MIIQLLKQDFSLQKMTRIQLELELIGGELLTVYVTAIDSVTVLSKYISGFSFSQIEFRHEKRVLSPAFSFAFLGIKGNERIVVCESKRNSKRSPVTKKLTDYRRRDRLTREIARVRDTCFRRIEGNVSSHKKLIARFRGMNKEHNPPPTVPLLAIETRSRQGPSEDALPCTWKENQS